VAENNKPPADLDLDALEAEASGRKSLSASAEEAAKGEAPKGGGNPLVEKFKALPRNQQIIIAVVGVLLVFAILGRLGGGNEPAPAEPQRQAAQADVSGGDAGADSPFAGVDVNRPALTQRWLQQQQRALSDLRDQVDGRLEQADQQMQSMFNQNQQLQNEIRGVVDEFRTEIRNLQAANRRDREVIQQLAEETQRLQQQTPLAGGAMAGDTGFQPRRTRIQQTPLGSPANLQVGQDQALLGGVVNRVDGRGNARRVQNGEDLGEIEPEEPKLPFIPPLGFVRGTLLNGLDALVGGQATPALVRLEGNYKTAANSTVVLDGCFMLVEFQGDISTERALGKPSRMTCVYPDRGAVTYSVSGYVVDAQDGIIGVPGVFYEGDATRIAAAMLADFAAGVAAVVEQNETTTTTNADGVTTQTLTGDDVRAQVSGGVEQAVGSLRDYLFERVNRVVPFVRIDNTRQLHLVLLSGTELREEGSPWTLLFSAEGR
jgi:hypothetical protein